MAQVTDQPPSAHFVRTGDNDPTISDIERARAVDASVLADPAPLGLTALSLPLLALSLINIGAVTATALPVFLTTALIFGGIGQFVVAMWEVRRGNTFGVVAFGTFGCFNIAVWYFFNFGLKEIPPADHATALELFLGLWTIPAFILWVASFRTTLVVNLIFLLATVLFVAAALGNGEGSETLVRISGWIGVALAAVAWYGCLAALTADTFERVLLPNPHLGKRARVPDR
jgi:succinate-acetate transporter protein